MSDGVFDKETQDSSSILALAQKLHDEHVAAGIEKAQVIVREAEEKAAKIVAGAEEDITDRKKFVEDLKQFEATYVASLRELVDEGQTLLNKTVTE